VNKTTLFFSIASCLVLLISASKEAIPAVAGSAVTSAFSKITNDITLGIGGIKSEVKSALTPVFGTLENITEEGSVSRDILNKAKGFFGITDDNGYSGHSQDAIIADKVNSLIAETDIAQDARSKFDSLVTTTKMKDMKTLVEISKLGFELSNYNTALHEKYYRKSLELKYKNIYEITKLRKSFEDKSKITEKLLDGIVSNTALPDAVKLHTKDVLKHRALTNMSDNLYKTISGDSEWVKALGKNINEKIDGIKTGIVSAIGGADMVASQVEMMNGAVDPEMLAMLSPEERAAMSKEAMAAGIVSDGLLGSL
jgi:hypothetical protein